MRVWEVTGDYEATEGCFYLVSCGDEQIYCETAETADAVATALNLQEQIEAGRN